MRFAKQSLRIVLLCLALAVALESEAAAADRQTISGRLIGDRGVFTSERCEIRLELGGLQTISTTYPDASGGFTFNNVSPGSYIIHVIADGYQEATHAIEIYENIGISQMAEIVLTRAIAYVRKDGSNVVDASQYLERYPKKAVDLYRKAIENRKKKKYDRAAQQLLEAIAIAPEFYHAHNDLGLVYRELGRIDEAESHLLRAHYINDSSADPLINLANLYIAAEKPEKAIEAGEKAVKNNSRSAPAFLNLGIAFYKAAKLDQAEAALRKALELAPKMFQVRLMLANVYMKLKRFDNLLEQLNSYLEENPKGEQRAAVQAMRDEMLKAKDDIQP